MVFHVDGMWTSTKGRGQAHVDRERGSKLDFLVDVINGWPLNWYSSSLCLLFIVSDINNKMYTLFHFRVCIDLFYFQGAYVFQSSGSSAVYILWHALWKAYYRCRGIKHIWNWMRRWLFGLPAASSVMQYLPHVKNSDRLLPIYEWTVASQQWHLITPMTFGVFMPACGFLRFPRLCQNIP